MVYTEDLKSSERNLMRVRLSPWAHKNKRLFLGSFVFILIKRVELREGSGESNLSRVGFFSKPRVLKE